MDVKNTQLLNCGWCTDTQDRFGPSMTNQGFKTRNGWFRKDYKLENEYRPEGYTFVARLHHELMGVDKSLPPGKIYS